MFQLLIKDNAVKAKENPETLYNDYVNASIGQESESIVRSRWI
jgi:hypothetical protein